MADRRVKLPGRRWLLVQAAALSASLQFLTIAPPIVRRPFDNREMGAAVGYFPLIGLLIGLLVSGARALAISAIGPLLAAALSLAVWVIATGALHLDGLLDSCDGLFGGHTPERRLEIMRDHHVGAFALTGGVLVLLVKCAALAEWADGWRALAIVPVAARCGLSLAVVMQPYARPQGTGSVLKANAGHAQALSAGIIGLAVALVLGGWSGLIVLVGTLLVQAAIIALIRSKIPGLTGDSYGALVELGELAALVLGACIR